MVIGNYFLEKLRRRRERLSVTPREVKQTANDHDDPAKDPPRALSDTTSPEPDNMPNRPGPSAEE